MADVVTTADLDGWLRGFAALIAENADELTALDSAIGDADHGTNMLRGTRAVVEKLDATTPDTVPALLKATGMTLVSKVGGASGPLYGTLFLEMAKASPDAAELDGPALAGALRAGVAGIVSRGKAEPGDKTMVDALIPAVDALDASLASGAGLDAAVSSAVDAARTGQEATRPLVARKGRASYLGERSAGHLDPGATSAVLLLESLATAVQGSG